VGQDLSNECGAVSCDGYYWGWDSNVCYQAANATADMVSCNGEGACQSYVDVCSMQPKGQASKTCHAICQEPNGDTCSDFTDGACTNVNPGEITCGTGACTTTVAQCSNGQLNNCFPGGGGEESCNNIDDDCDGITDDGILSASDSYEDNNTSGAATNLGTIPEDDAARNFYASIYPVNDVDWFYFYADEASHACVPFTNQSYSVELILTPPGGNDCVDYDIELYDNSGNRLSSSTVSGCASDSIDYGWGGTCGGDDSRTFRVKIIGYNGIWECVEYSLSIQMN
jgi:hypothetical protein